MEAATLTRALDSMKSLKSDGPQRLVNDDYAVTAYVGRPGQAMVIRQVKSIKLDEDVVILETKEKGTLYLATVDLHALGESEADGREDRRAGFA